MKSLLFIDRLPAGVPPAGPIGEGPVGIQGGRGQVALGSETVGTMRTAARGAALIDALSAYLEALVQD